MINSIQYTTISATATRLGINKSQLLYWTHEGLLTPLQLVGKTMLFDSDSLLTQIKFIQEQKKAGKTIKEIKELKLKQ